MKGNTSISQKTIKDINKLLLLINNLQITRNKFMRRCRLHNCKCLIVLPSIEHIEKNKVQITALRDLAIFVIKHQDYAPLPTLTELIRKKIGEHIVFVKDSQDIFVKQALIHDLKTTKFY